MGLIAIWNMQEELKAALDDVVEEKELEERRPRSIWQRWVFAVVTLFLIAGLIWLSGGYQAFLYRRTPPIIEKEFQSVFEAEKITLLLNIIVFQNEGNLGSQRDEPDIRRLVENASSIWAQADIELSIKAIHQMEASDELITSFLEQPDLFAKEVPKFDPTLFNLFLVGSLGGINGIAFGGINSMAVADFTSVYDFRATAHEVGHLLGLSHTDESRDRLMFEGANGTRLTEGEVMIAYKHALKLFGR